jgi:hypothetical protein
MARYTVKHGLKWCFAAVIASSILSCTSAVRRDEPPGQAAKAETANLKYSSLNLRLNDNAKKLLADNIKFNPDVLKNTMQRILTAKNLIAADSPYQIDVEITDIRVRSNFSAVMFGFLAGSDSLAGNVYVKEKNGRPLTRYEVSASYALGGIAGGQDDTRMGWLYEEFAKLAVNELARQNQK